MQKNYHAWDVVPEAFPAHASDADQLRFLLRFAVLAPSSHNSQPWHFRVDQGTLTLGPDFSRALPIGDANHRQLFISLGCGAENIRVAADYYGFTAIMEYMGEGSDAELIIRLSRHSSSEANNVNDHLIYAIAARHTNRNPYAPKLPDEKFLVFLRGLATQGVQISLIREQTQKDAVADVILRAGAVAMRDAKFRKELSRYVKSNVTRSFIGMPGFGMGFPTPVSFLAPLMLRWVNMSGFTRAKDEKLLKRQTPLFGIIRTRDDTPHQWISAGQLYERIALEAAREGINTAPMAAAIQIGDFYQELQKILNTSFRPQVFFRMGYAAGSTPHSPRLPVDKVIKS